MSDAVELLEQHGEDARVLAGGQSLMPLLNLRLARPAALVDVNRIAELDHLTPWPDGGLRIGAMTRERTVELSTLVSERSPLMSAAMPLIGHFQIRNRGTIGGSIAHADPAGELPAVALALDAELVVNGKSERVISADDFFDTYYTTTLQPGEMLTEIRLPAWHGARGWAIEEVCRREGDFAMVGAIAHFELTAGNVCADPRIVLFGVGERPMRMTSVEEALAGRTLDDDAVQEAGALVADTVDPDEDVHASAEYRKEVAGTLTKRVLLAARERAKQGA